MKYLYLAGEKSTFQLIDPVPSEQTRKLVQTPDFNIHVCTTTMATMRKAAGISLIVMGTVWLTLWASVMLRSPLPIPGFILRRLGSFAYYVDPVEAPIWGLVFLTGGVVLLWRRQRVRHS